LARIVRRVEDAQVEKAAVERFIDSFARWYTPAAGILALLMFLFTHRLEAALTLLVIACPGALVISTPAAIMAGIGRAAQLGILIKGGVHLERAGATSVVAFDKTGTLTEGRPRLTDVAPLHPALGGPYESGAPWTPAQQDVLRWAAVAEAGSAHPIAQPIVVEATRFGRLPCAEPASPRLGRGVEAACAAHAVAVGSLALMREIGVTVPPAAVSTLREFGEDGKTAVVAARDGRAMGVLAVADELRESARPMLKQLRKMGIGRIAILTGDDSRTASALARKLGIREVHSGLLPEAKLDLVRRMQTEGGTVAMVGDGINDAPAMAAADVGIAMGNGAASLAIDTADIVILNNDLRKIPEAIRIARATRRNMRQNIAIALLTVAGLIGGVLTGSIHMATGMLIHEMSVLMVTFNAIRLLRA
jgi:Cd2+/Zn2+-exporting ATPase